MMRVTRPLTVAPPGMQRGGCAMSVDAGCNRPRRMRAGRGSATADGSTHE